MRKKGYRLGIDVGGTFTDFVLAASDGSELYFHKEPSQPQDPSKAVDIGSQFLIEKHSLLTEDVELVVHGTTIALNAIIQKRGARVALVVSKGNRDIMEIANGRMPSSYDFTAGREAPLISRDSVFEISARTLSDGSILTPVDSKEVIEIAKDIGDGQYDSVAVVLLNSYLNSKLEIEVKNLLQDLLPQCQVISSTEIWPEMKEYQRALVTCLNAYIHPLIDEYFNNLEKKFAAMGLEAPIFITANNGGTISLDTARSRPIDTVLSGPASGVLAATRISENYKSLITFDMGGTSTDISISRAGKPEYTHSTQIGDYPLMLPVVDVAAIGAGGGSIVWTDNQGFLKVGPESAGAVPGPICYDLGGENPTITDCYLTLGIIDASNFNDGRLELKDEASKLAMEKIAEVLELSSGPVAAEAALQVATAKMATELRKILAQNGLDPSGYKLVAFGGAGPTQATMLAEEANLDAVLIPNLPGTFCALGAIQADIQRDYVRPVRSKISRQGSGWSTISLALAELEKEASEWIAEEGKIVKKHEFKLIFDVRYPSQAFELPVEIYAYDKEQLIHTTVFDLFNAEHKRLYGFQETDSDLEVTNLRLSVIGLVDRWKLKISEKIKSIQQVNERLVYWQGWHKTPIFSRDTLTPSSVIDGMAIIEQPDSTIFVPPEWQAHLDEDQNILITRKVGK